AAADLRPPAIRPDEPVEDLEERGLAGAVAADEAEALAAPQLERDVLKRPELAGAQRPAVVRARGTPRQKFRERIARAVAQGLAEIAAVLLADVLNADEHFSRFGTPVRRPQGHGLVHGAALLQEPRRSMRMGMDRRYATAIAASSSTKIPSTTRSGMSRSAGMPASQPRPASITGVRGFHRNTVPARPPAGAGKTTGARYMRNCRASGRARATSVQSMPTGARNSPTVVPMSTSERNAAGKRTSVQPGTIPRSRSAASSTATRTVPLNSTCRMPERISASRGKLILTSMARAAVACWSGALTASLNTAQSTVPEKTKATYGMAVPSMATTPVRRRKVQMTVFATGSRNTQRKPSAA